MFHIVSWASSMGTSLAILATALSAVAQDPAPPLPAAPPKAPTVANAPLTKTICVPQIVMEKRLVKVVECRPEWRECPVTIVNHVPETTWVDQELCVLNPERRITTICVRVCKPIIERQEITYCASEPVHCTTKCSRTVCKPVAVKVNRTICVDEGHWVEKPCCTSGCDECKLQCGPPRVKKEWCSKMVTKNVCVNVWKPQWVEECYDKVTTTIRCANRTSIVNVITGYTKECQTREIFSTVCVPTTVVRQVPVTTFKCVEIPYTKRYCVMVPHCVEKEIEVPVCRMVKKTVQCESGASSFEDIAQGPGR